MNSTTLKNGMRIQDKYGDWHTVNYVIDNIVYCYEGFNNRVHVYNIIAVRYA